MFRNIRPRTTRLIRSTLVLATVGWLLLAAVGCGCKPKTDVKALQVTISRDASLNDKLVTVVLFAVRDNEMAKWRGENAEPASTLTRESGMGPAVESAVKRFYFTPEGEDSVVLSRNDPIWSLWRGREGWTVVAVADTEAVGQNKSPARPTFSIDACDWKKRIAVVELFVDEQGVRFNKNSSTATTTMRGK